MHVKRETCSIYIYIYIFRDQFVKSYLVLSAIPTILRLLPDSDDMTVHEY